MGLVARDLCELSGLGKLNVMMTRLCEFSVKISKTVIVLVWLKHCKTNFYCKHFCSNF